MQVYLLQAFSAADIAFRSVVGIAIDSRTLSYESLMLLGFAVQGLTYEWLVWANTLPQMIAASAFVGATFGSRSSLLAPALVKDFGIGTLPVIMGGVFFCAGVPCEWCNALLQTSEATGSLNDLIRKMDNGGLAYP
ncbi:hypothetical protein HPB49_005658 [Dermacentor silvarum]|uniref:Uncharacterized protein n=1 Tax=Dermacentor silvarum TaxID=543639 RepID=A0ACB8CPX0_DERSI|nr:hypothetical protein HPB49_005658 [Dermacentor silvarum]